MALTRGLKRSFLRTLRERENGNNSVAIAVFFSFFSFLANFHNLARKKRGFKKKTNGPKSPHVREKILRSSN
jgi:hypothetical protein